MTETTAYQVIGTRPVRPDGVNAIYRALGKRFTELPMSPSRVWRAWRGEGRQEGRQEGTS
jgi:hypothetical protein